MRKLLSKKGITSLMIIKNINSKNNPTEFEYKLSENSDLKKATIKSVKEFGITNSTKYIRNKTNIDRSSENITFLSSKRNPIFIEEVVFLNVLVEGKSNLYEYVDGNLRRYFYTKRDAKIEQLIFKSYLTKENNIGINNGYKDQLLTHLKCPNFEMNTIESLDYERNHLIRFFNNYSACHNIALINYETKQKRGFFNLTIRPRINNSSLTIQNSSSNSRDTDFENKTGFGFGLEVEYMLPFNKNKWAIAIEPSYQSFRSEKTTNVRDVSGGVLIANVDYSSIEIPISIRHYFFLNSASKIFINASYFFDVNSKSSIEFSRNDGSNLNTLEIEARKNLAIGIGYKQNDKYSLEVRYQTNRDILGNYLSWSSKYKTVSVIFGYSLF